MREHTDIKGVVGAAITPVDQNFEIDVARLKAHCDTMLAEGCAFTSVFGTTGEGASFSTDQKLVALYALKDAGMDMSRQIPAILATSIDEATRLYAGAAELGCRAALIIPPFYYKPSGLEGTSDFYAALVERAGAPGLDIVLYNFPVFSGVTLNVPQVEDILSRTGDLIVGIKDSSGDLDGGLALIKAFPQLSIFTGDDRILPSMLAAGGAGLIGGMVNLYPADAVAFLNAPNDSEKHAQAAQRIKVVDGNGGTLVIKGLLASWRSDPEFSRTVPPLRSITATEINRVVAELEGN